MLALIDGDPIVYAAVWGRSLGDAKARVLSLIEENVEATYSNDYMIAVGTSFNFRDDIHPFYKKSASREKSRESKPEWFGEIIEFLREQPNIVKCIGYEADDQLRMWSEQARSAGDPYVICSIDKDLDCIPGTHYSSKTRETYEVTEEEANHFYWQQMLQGDNVDNIPGLPGIGPKKAAKILEGASSNEERRTRVIQAYKDKYPDDWKHALLFNGKLIHMWRFNSDHFVLN
jgi:5'-3' exonuclease